MRDPVALLAAALALGGLAAVAQSASTALRPAVAAHRGGALLWPENSLLAFANAVAVGVEYLELDVHLSRDGRGRGDPRCHPGSNDHRDAAPCAIGRWPSCGRSGCGTGTGR